MPICNPCRIAADMKILSSHELCIGKTHCDCQHRIISDSPPSEGEVNNGTGTGEPSKQDGEGSQTSG